MPRLHTAQDILQFLSPDGFARRITSEDNVEEKDDDINDLNISIPADEEVQALRLFAGIICSSCQYLEFPGCDSHCLYTESLPNGHAKCSQCNVRIVKKL